MYKYKFTFNNNSTNTFSLMYHIMKRNILITYSHIQLSS